MVLPHSVLTLRGTQVCTVAGITYRQLDYWARTGVLRPTVAEARGSGTQRLYSLADVHVATAVAELVRCGMPPSRLGDVAAQLQALPIERWPDFVVVVGGEGGLLSFDDVLDLVQAGTSVAILCLRHLVGEVAAAISELVAYA